MKTYLISYDLIKEYDSAGYTKLFKAIKSHAAWCRVTLSTWIVNTDSTEDQVYDTVNATLDANDKLFVSRITVPAVWKNLPAEVSDWLKEELN